MCIFKQFFILRPFTVINRSYPYTPISSGVLGNLLLDRNLFILIRVYNYLCVSLWKML